MIPNAKRLKRGLKDISPLFDQKQEMKLEGRVTLENPKPVQFLGIFCSKNPRQNLFLDKVEMDVLEKHQFQALEIALRAKPARWWGTHKNNFVDWKEYRRMMKLWFGYANTRIIEKYIGNYDSRKHLARWKKAWGEEPQPEWVHIFCHTLDTILMNWYLETKM